MQRNRTIMIAVLALLVPVLTLAGCTAAAPSTTPTTITVGSQQEGIWVSGEGEVQAVPDTATINLGVQAQAPTVAEAQSQAQVAMDAVMAALKANGVAEKDIQTTDYNVWQQTRWDSNKNEEQVIGYQVSNTVSVKVRKVAEAGTVLDAAVAAGGDLIRVQGIYFAVDDPSSFYEQARAKAMDDAKAKARQLADLADVKLGKPTYITSSHYSPIIYRGIEMSVKDSAGGVPAPTTPVTPGETTITATVQIAYAIE